MFEELVIRTKLTPPRARRYTLRRPRLIAHLSEALQHRLSIVHAGTGYGKSTALAALADQDIPLCWYGAAPEDTDPFVFFLHLVYAFRLSLPNLSDAPLATLERQSDQLGPDTWKPVVHMLINALADILDRPTLLILDDFHLVGDVPQIATIVDRLVGYAPHNLHVILSGRHPPSLPGLVVWRARGELLKIDHRDLAFTPDEVTALFHEAYGYQLSPPEIASLMTETEGWAIALQLIWQGLRSGAITDLATRLSPLSSSPSLDDLFHYLAQEVFDKQPPDIQSFLQTTSVLRQMSPAACDALREAHDSAAMLTYLYERDLFLVDLGEGQSRYQHLFHDFIRHQLPRDEARALHMRAGDYFHSINDEERALYHLLTAGAHQAAATLLDGIGAKMVRQGRLDTLAGWIGQLPPAVLEAHPALVTCLGDVARLRSHFDEALGWYTQAEAYWRARDDRMGASRALQRQALVYLDTVRPSRAESLLAEALRLSEGQQDRQDRARLLELLAENKLNLGQPEEAERLRVEARQWREEGPSESQLGVRVLIRTGQLEGARVMLETQAGIEEGAEGLSELGRSHHSHREVQLLLSLVYAFQGQAEAAFETAQAGIAIGQQMGSPFVTAVGYMRLGHAWLIRPQPDAHLRAIECYKKAIALGDVVAVRRTRVEAQWGLCRAYGFHGDLTTAEEAAALGIKIGRQAGDPWVVALIELTLGASYVLAGRHAQAVAILQRVIAAFRDCSDSYGHTAAHLWLGLAYLRLGQGEHLAETADELLRLTETHGYDHLFTRRALLGPHSNRVLVPLLLEARRRRRRPSAVTRLLNAAGLPDVEVHPGYQLRVQTLGDFRVWRGDEEIDARTWRRVKARQLFQLLLTYRGRTMQREEIADILWPDLDPEAIQRHFKVALNALNRALEPERPPGSEPAYILRHSTTYGLRPGADLWLDVDEFKRLIKEGDRCQDDPQTSTDAYQCALDLYQGPYLQEALYEDWTSEERERLLALYLRTAEKLATARLAQGRFDETIEWSRRILAVDNCWERAYRLMMVAYARQGNRPRALRVFQACEETLRRELDTEPGPAIRRLGEQLSSGAPVKDWTS
jgi:LuxR family maltose regulon positive regulatory protein